MSKTTSGDDRVASFVQTLGPTMRQAVEQLGAQLCTQHGPRPLGFAVVAIYPPLPGDEGPQFGVVQQGSLAGMNASEQAELAYACAETFQVHGDKLILRQADAGRAH